MKVPGAVPEPAATILVVFEGEEGVAGTGL